MRTYIPFLALCFAAPSSFALPVQVEPSQSLRQEGTIRARGDPNLASWVTAGVGGLAAALLGGYMTRDSPLPRKPQGELEILHEEAMKYRGSEPNTAACVYRKGKDFFSNFDRLDLLEPEIQMKLMIKWVADCRGEIVPDIVAKAEEEALLILERDNAESSDARAADGETPKDQENRFQSSSDILGRWGFSGGLKRAFSRAGGALQKVHGGHVPGMTRPYGMGRLMFPG